MSRQRYCPSVWSVSRRIHLESRLSDVRPHGMNVTRNKLAHEELEERQVRGKRKRERRKNRRKKLEKERERERPEGARRNEKRNRLRGWKQRTDRSFVIRKLACSNCGHSADCHSAVVGRRGGNRGRCRHGVGSWSERERERDRRGKQTSKLAREKKRGITGRKQKKELQGERFLSKRIKQLQRGERRKKDDDKEK